MTPEGGGSRKDSPILSYDPTEDEMDYEEEIAKRDRTVTQLLDALEEAIFWLDKFSPGNRVDLAPVIVRSRDLIAGIKEAKGE